jgi:hypothetical protein
LHSQKFNIIDPVLLMKYVSFCKKTSTGLAVLFGIGPSRRKLFSFGFETKLA